MKYPCITCCRSHQTDVCIKCKWFYQNVDKELDDLYLSKLEQEKKDNAL